MHDSESDKNRQASVQVTPEMIEAGAFEMLCYDWEWGGDPDQTMRDILRAVFGDDVVTFHEVVHLKS